jgi:hypothetical protein
MANFESKFSIGQDVLVKTNFDGNEIELGSASYYATIIAVRFTKAKVFYDVITDSAIVQRNVPSDNVKEKNQ